MKRCPTCQRTFTDPNLSFCVDDGSPLRLDDGDDTVVKPDDLGAVAYKPPTTSMPDKPATRLWPWLLGIGIVILVLAGLGIGAALLLPKYINQQRANREAPNVQQNSNSSDEGAQTNTNETVETVETDNTPAPTDKEVVLAQLTQLENEWTVANINADKKKLNLILADDYVGPATPDPNGPTEGKDEYIKRIKRDTSIQKWEFKDLQLTLRGERATLIGKVDFTVDGRVHPFTFADKFVWRNGRWQATGSVVTPVAEG